ncbi:hypothetical protein QM007_04590 [Rothia sp. SD9660Na]|nr:hypothetical protein [Rothia sp. SD9660Na]WHS51252.1 hypothetical protein QM007_04590 [Rothia sp. SD9660Na]
MTARINLNRRSFFIVSGVAGMTGLLTACGRPTPWASAASIPTTAPPTK